MIIKEWEATTCTPDEVTNDEFVEVYHWALLDNGEIAQKLVETMDGNGHIEPVGESYHVVGRVRGKTLGSRETSAIRVIVARYHHTMQKALL